MWSVRELARRRRFRYTEAVSQVFSPLSDHQVAVLSWIANGCPEGVMEGHSHKTTAIALQNRKLAVVSRKGGVWRATLTGAGAYYLDHGTYQPPPEAPGKQRQPHPPAPPLPRRQVEHSSQRPRRTTAPPKALSPTGRLIADLHANGEIKVSGPDRAKYEARVAAAIRFGKVPEGKQLVTDGGRWSREYVVRLRDAPAWLTATLEPVPVPAMLRRPHPVVTVLQGEKRLVRLDRSVVHRALLLIQALAAEAVRRGYTVKETKITTDAYGYQHRETKDQFTITIGRHSVGVELRQEVNRARHQPTPAEEIKAASDRWYRIPKYDVTPSDRLSIHLSGRFEHRQSKWSDGANGQLEVWLTQILQEIELRAEAAEQERVAAVAEAERRRRQWERAMDQAKEDYAEDFRARALFRQVDSWARTRQVRDYLDALQARIDTIADFDDGLAAKEWHRWSEEWAATADPLVQPLAMPVVPEPKPDDLKPFLNGWNPYGPDRSGW